MDGSTEGQAQPQAAAPSEHPRAATGEPVRRMRRTERREQILTAATRAFARTGFAATSLDDIATEAQVSRVILYRHFESKTDLYRAVLERAQRRLADTVGTGNYDADTIPTLLHAAGADPEGFRLLFRHAAREPEFRDLAERLSAVSTAVTRRHLAGAVPDQRWAAWASQLLPIVVIEAVIAWLDAGQPDPEQAGARIYALVREVVDTARRDQS